MAKNNVVTHYEIPVATGTIEPRQWIAEGQAMARTDPAGVFETIDVTHAAETASHAVQIKQLSDKGTATLVRWTPIKNKLEEMGLDIAQYMHYLARGKFDLRLAVALLVVSGALMAFTGYGFAPLWLTIILAFLCVASATTIEEFFQAHSERVVLREGIFMVASVMFLAAQFWFGTLRAVLLEARAPEVAGPATTALATGASVLRFTLGVFAAITELVAGYKLWHARQALFSPTALAVRERDHCAKEFLMLRAAIEQAKAEPEVRRHYRRVGARQELAWAAGAEGRASASHLKRALKGAAIALAIIVVLLFLSNYASAATVTSRNKVVLLDLSLSETPEDLKANIDEVSLIMGTLKVGDHITVVGITDQFGKPAILLNETMPGDAGHYGLAEQASRETIIAKWRQASKGLAPAFALTDILGTLQTLSYLADFSSSGTQIFILSDMQQDSAELDLEHAKLIPVERTIAGLKQGAAIASLKGATVFALGVDPRAKSRRYFVSLREFWLAYFRESGAELRVFAIDRQLPNF